MKKRLYKSNKFRMICGVCGGWAELLNWDPTIIRIIFILLSLFKGVGIFLYIVLAFIMPSPLSIESSEDNKENIEEDSEKVQKNSVKKSNKQSKKNTEIHTDKEFNEFFDNKK